MVNRKISPEPLLQITRAGEVVIIEYICEKAETYRWCEYDFSDAEDRAKRFEEDLKIVANMVKGSDFSFYASEEEVMIDYTDLISISVSTDYMGCKFLQH
ncbi:MAG: hypothetical protein Q8908_12125 [Bacteroidota bacterium]|nr:hypothetical protein [Bacteroidota bacterium]